MLQLTKFLFAIYLIFSSLAFADERYLLGNVKAYTPSGKEEPMPSVEVSLLYKDKVHSVTDSQGRFRLDLNSDKRLTSGKKITIKINEPGWFILFPFRGEMFVPAELDNYEVKVKLVTNSSRLALDSFSASIAGKDNSGSKISQMFSVQVLTTTSREAAFTTKDFFSSKSFRTYIQVTKSFNDIVYYKVLLGNYLTKSKANTEKKRIRRKYPSYKDAFVKLIAK